MFNKRKRFIRKLIKQKTKAQVHLELDLDFIASQHKEIFSMNEDKLREKLGEAKKHNNKKSAKKIEDEISKYKSIKSIYIKTKNELELVKQYLDYLKGQL